MPVRNIADIFVPPSRLRREVGADDLTKLIDSILSKGLMHPPVVLASGELLAGERRFRAIQEIQRRGLAHDCNGKHIIPGLIMTTDILDLSNDDKLEAELEENVLRVDLTWQEISEARAALHDLRSRQRATEASGAMSKEENMALTVAEIKAKAVEDVNRYETAHLQKDLVMAEWIRAHPDDAEVANAKTRTEGLRIIERKLEDEYRIALSKQFLANRPTSGHILRQIDMLDALIDTPANLYDCIITDPPWGAGAHDWQNGTSTRRHSYHDDLATSEKIHECLAVEGYRIAKPKSHLYLFCSYQRFDDLARVFRSAGWDVWPRPLIWWHGSQGIPPRPEHGPKNTYECILFGNKGDKRVTAVLPDVIPALKATLDSRAAEKPPGIYYQLLRRSCLPGDEILDPCCGTGPVFPAANALEIRATGYDIAPDAIGIASGRLAERYIHFEPTIDWSKVGADRNKRSKPA